MQNIELQSKEHSILRRVALSSFVSGAGYSLFLAFNQLGLFFQFSELLRQEQGQLPLLILVCLVCGTLILSLRRVSVSGTGIEYMRIANATGGQYLIYSQKESAKAIEDVIRQYANDSADIVILVDVSGSMSNNVKDISKESDKIVQAMPIGSRLGGAVFKFSKHPKWFQFSDLNEDHYYALDLITSPRKYMSSESHYDAMLKAIHSNSWKNRKRMIITLTDEYVESGENFNPSSAVISAANANNIELHTIMLSY